MIFGPKCGKIWDVYEPLGNRVEVLHFDTLSAERIVVLTIGSEEGTH